MNDNNDLEDEVIPMKERIIQIIKENLRFWYNKETNTIHPHEDYLAKALEEYFKEEAYQEMLEKKVINIREKAKESFDGEDIEGIKERLIEEGKESEFEYHIYSDGYFQGTVDCYEYLTGEEYRL